MARQGTLGTASGASASRATDPRREYRGRHVIALADYRDAAALVQTATRDGFGTGLVEAGRHDPNVVAVCADLAESTRMQDFRDAFPERFIEIGVQEQLLAAMSAGLAMAGKIPFIASYAMFCPGRAWEQVRTNICLNDANVKIAGAHAVSYTHLRAHETGRNLVCRLLLE